ncbi:MAG TPA: chemotaxis protein CheW, partial [Spirochaetales bacterium]|nr:chemotaxis protein CheW [Spirochaetales bacterium]
LVIGALTDAVHEVVDIDEGHMEPAPRFGTRIDSGLIHAIGKRGESFVIVLDIDKAFRGDETEELARAAGAAS